ncbi:MAG: hypothetical protein ACKVU1_13990 [bacterium]
MERDSVVRTIYLYIFALLGLVFITIGGVRFVDMGLKAFVFTQADNEQRIYARQPPMPAMRPDMERWASSDAVTEEQRETIQQWLADYENWRETSAKLDVVTAQRQRDASTSLAFMIVGMPLYLAHWRLIRKRPLG